MLKIKELRLAQELTQKDLAEKCNISSKSIWAYENNIAVPPLDVLIKLADFFECSIDYLTGREDDFGVIKIQNVDDKEMSAGEKEILAIYGALPTEYQAQILEYARYFNTRLNKSKRG